MSAASQPPVIAVVAFADTLDLYDSASGKRDHLDNNLDGHAIIIERALANKAEVCFEAANGHEWRLWYTLALANVPVRQLRPYEVIKFAISQGQWNKDNRIDAQIIAQFAELNPTSGHTFPARKHRFLKALVARQYKLVTLQKQLLLHKTGEDIIDHSEEIEQIDADILAILESKIANLEDRFLEVVREDPILARKDQIIRSVPGLDSIASATILAEIPQLGCIRSRSASAIANVTPKALDDDSGPEEQARSNGRKALKNAISQAAYIAIDCNPDMKIFAEKLEKKGKLKPVIIVAVARKLIVILNALLKKDQLWNE